MCGRSLEERTRSEYHQMDDLFFCKQWYLDRKRSKRSLPDNELPATVDETDTRSQSITLPFIGTQKFHNKCVFGCERRVLRRLSREECLEIFIQTNNVYVPYSGRFCSHHGEGDSFKVPDDFAISHLPVSVNAEEVASCLASMKNIVMSERNNIFKSQAVHFSNMSDNVLKFEIVLNKKQLQYLLQCVENGQLYGRHPEFANGVFLSHLR